MPIRIARRVFRRVTPPKGEFDTDLDALSQDSLINVILFQRSRIADLEVERLGLMRTIISQQRRLRDERELYAALLGEHDR